MNTDETFNDLYTRYYSTILSQILRRVENMQTAEDLTQETFMKVYHALPHTVLSYNIHPWLYVIALNVVRDYSRSFKSKHGKNEDISGWYDSLHYSSMEEEIENRELLKRVFKYLPVRTQLILVLFAIYGYTLPEIAEMLQVKYNNIKTAQYRERLRVQKLFRRELS